MWRGAEPLVHWVTSDPEQLLDRVRRAIAGLRGAVPGFSLVVLFTRSAFAEVDRAEFEELRERGAAMQVTILSTGDAGPQGR